MVTASPTPTILDQLGSLAEPTRSRTLLLLDGHELTVSELCGVLQLPQSTVSRHLKALADAGWVAARAEGTRHLYTMPRPGPGPGPGPGPDPDADPGQRSGPGVDGAARRLWQLVREQLRPTAAAAQDQRRLQAALAARRTASRQFFASSAGQWNRLRDELFGERFHLAALAAFAGEAWTVGDLGCGTGPVSAALAPFVARVVAVDASPAMLDAARERLAGYPNVDLRPGELEALPVEDATLDAATLVLVLHYVPEPERALAEAARVLKPGGRLVVVDMLPHDRERYRQQMGHVWLGFGQEQLQALLATAGFDGLRLIPLPPESQARGPALFVATAHRAPGAPGAPGAPRGARLT